MLLGCREQIGPYITGEYVEEEDVVSAKSVQRGGRQFYDYDIEARAGHHLATFTVKVRTSQGCSCRVGWPVEGWATGRLAATRGQGCAGMALAVAPPRCRPPLGAGRARIPADDHDRQGGLRVAPAGGCCII